MRAEKEIRERLQEIMKEEDIDPTKPMFKYTHGYPIKGGSTRGYTHGFYTGFYHAFKWVLEEEDEVEVNK